MTGKPGGRTLLMRRKRQDLYDSVGYGKTNRPWHSAAIGPRRRRGAVLSSHPAKWPFLCTWEDTIPNSVVGDCTVPTFNPCRWRTARLITPRVCDGDVGMFR